MGLVHVHGYNVNDQDARGEQAETFKRLYWSGSRARFWGITWYGWDSQWTNSYPVVGQRSPNYHVNVRNAFNTGRLLKEFVAGNQLSGATIFAHSLGNMVVSSGIREGMAIGRYLMVNAAVAEEAYTPESAYNGGTDYAAGSTWHLATRESMFHPAWRYPDGVEVPFEYAYSPRLWSSEWYKLFDTSDGRSTLTWRDFFARVRTPNTYVYYAPTDEAFRPFNYTVEMAASDPDPDPDPDGSNYPPNSDDWPGGEDVLQILYLDGSKKLGTYSWAIQELLKGRMLSLPGILGDRDSDTSGWGFNLADAEYWRTRLSVIVPIESAKANDIRPEQLKRRPFFIKNPDFEFLYTDQPAPVSAPLREEMLANELPSLTFAAGHRGVGFFNDKNMGIDIRDKFLVKKPGALWPADRPRFEWRHSDIYVVAYPYLSGLYDEWVKKN